MNPAAGSFRGTGVNLDEPYGGVPAPDSSLFDMDRSGSIAINGFRMRRDLADFQLLPGLQVEYYREQRTNPYSGEPERLSQVKAGPSLGVGTQIDKSPLELRLEMGLVFPCFRSVQGRTGLSLLAS